MREEEKWKTELRQDIVNKEDEIVKTILTSGGQKIKILTKTGKVLDISINMIWWE